MLLEARLAVDVLALGHTGLSFEVLAADLARKALGMPVLVLDRDLKQEGGGGRGEGEWAFQEARWSREMDREEGREGQITGRLFPLPLPLFLDLPKH